MTGFSCLDCRCPDVSYDAEAMDGDLKSPNHPGRYCARLNCSYSILPDPELAIRLHFDAFRTEMRHDYLEIKMVENNQPFTVAR